MAGAVVVSPAASVGTVVLEELVVPSGSTTSDGVAASGDALEHAVASNASNAMNTAGRWSRGEGPWLIMITVVTLDLTWTVPTSSLLGA